MDVDSKKIEEFKKAKLWRIPSTRLDKVEGLWNEAKKTINEGVVITRVGRRNFNNFLGTTFSGVGYVRPHAKDNNDTYPLPDGRKMPKQCFWFNAEYIKEEIID